MQIMGLVFGFSLLLAQGTSNEGRLKTQVKILLESLREANRTTQEALAIHNPDQTSSKPEDKDTLAEALARIESLKAENNRLYDAIYRMVEIVQNEQPALAKRFDFILEEIEKVQDAKDFTSDLEKANIIGYDPQTGLVVLGIGSAQGVKLGMNYVFFGSDSRENRLVVADVREQIAGALVLEGASPIQLGLEVNLVIENWYKQSDGNQINIQICTRLC